MVRFLAILILILSPIYSFTDGNCLEVYTPDNSGLAWGEVSCMAIDENGVKWFGHDHGYGISVFDGNTWEILKPCESTYLCISDILFDEDYVWVATTLGLYRYDGLSWYVIPETEYFSIDSVVKGPDGALWFGGGLSMVDLRRTVSRLKDGELTTWFGGGYGNNTTFAANMLFDQNGVLWVGGTGALCCYDGIRWSMHKIDNLSITKMLINTDGTLWFLNRGGYTVTYYNSGNWSSYSEDILNMAIDKNNTVYGIWNDYFNIIDNIEVKGYDLCGLDDLSSMAFNLIAFDIDGTLWFAGDTLSDCSIAHISLTDLNPPENRFPLEDIIQPVEFSSSPQPEVGSYNPDDKFPLSIGNTWVYRREFKPSSSSWEDPVFQDKTILTIVDTVTVDDILYYKFLDGRLLGKNENGNIYESSGLRFDFSPCSEETCEDGIYYYHSPFFWDDVRRIETEVTVGTETFNGFLFRFHHTHGSIYTTVPGIGMTSMRIVSDIGYTDNLFLEYACINGVEIGSSDVYVEDSAPVPFELLTPYPNPFNPSTVISYTLRNSGPIRLTVYNVTGQLVSVLKDEYQQAGAHSITWDAAGMPSGLYFCTLKTDRFSETRKMMLIK